MQRLIWTVIASFAMAIVLGPIVIPWLKRMKFGKEIYDLGPQTHKKKQGTPQMGGIIFAIPALIATLAFSYGTARWDFMLMAVVSAVRRPRTMTRPAAIWPIPCTRSTPSPVMLSS